MPKRPTAQKRIPVGTKVRFKLAGKDVRGVVVEDRGPLGIGGELIVRVRVKMGVKVEGVELTRDFELPISDVRIAA